MCPVGGVWEPNGRDRPTPPITALRRHEPWWADAARGAAGGGVRGSAGLQRRACWMPRPRLVVSGRGDLQLRPRVPGRGLEFQGATQDGPVDRAVRMAGRVAAGARAAGAGTS